MQTTLLPSAADLSLHLYRRTQSSYSSFANSFFVWDPLFFLLLLPSLLQCFSTLTFLIYLKCVWLISWNILYWLGCFAMVLPSFFCCCFWNKICCILPCSHWSGQVSAGGHCAPMVRAAIIPKSLKWEVFPANKTCLLLSHFPAPLFFLLSISSQLEGRSGEVHRHFFSRFFIMPNCHFMVFSNPDTSRGLLCPHITVLCFLPHESWNILSQLQCQTVVPGGDCLELHCISGPGFAHCPSSNPRLSFRQDTLALPKTKYCSEGNIIGHIWAPN